MARLVLIISKSGTGKSSSMRNLKKGEASVILSSGKELPFKSDLATFVPKNYIDVHTAIEKASSPIVVIDDANYLMSFEEMSRVMEVGYAKFTQMAQNMFNIFKAIINKPSDQTFYIMAHAAETEDGRIQFKTTGKMLSEKIVLEGLTNVLLTNEITPEGEFVFRVKTDGTGVKTPLGMFTTETIPNDLKIVNDAILKFYKEDKKIMGEDVTEKERAVLRSKLNVAARDAEIPVKSVVESTFDEGYLQLEILESTIGQLEKRLDCISLHNPSTEDEGIEKDYDMSALRRGVNNLVNRIRFARERIETIIDELEI